MTRPTVPPVADILYDELAVSQPGDDLRGWPLLLFLGALGKTFGPLHDLVRDTDQGAGWTAIMDPARAPGFGLDWLERVAGVPTTAGLTDQQRRDRIASPPSYRRGTIDGLKAAVVGTLVGTRYVFARERDGSPYRVTIVTRTSDTPDPAATLLAARSQKPAGLLLTHLVTTVRTWLEIGTTQPTWAAVAGTYGTWDAVRGF